MKRILAVFLLAFPAGSGTRLAGERFDGNASEAELQSWIEELQ